jgi:hypothetical protein
MPIRTGSVLLNKKANAKYECLQGSTTSRKHGQSQGGSVPTRFQTLFGTLQGSSRWQGMLRGSFGGAREAQSCKIDLCFIMQGSFGTLHGSSRCLKIINSAPFLKTSIITANKESVIWFDELQRLLSNRMPKRAWTRNVKQRHHTSKFAVSIFSVIIQGSFGTLQGSSRCQRS